MSAVGVRRGRGIAPHWDDKRVLWIVVWIFSATLDLRYWRFGVGFRAWSIGLYLGPVSLGVGKPRWRWRTVPTTSGSLPVDTYQDWSVTITSVEPSGGAA